MSATTYNLPIAYLPFLNKGKKKKDSGCGCGKKHDSQEDCDECNKTPCDDDKKCGCCPPGLVSVFDDNDEFVGCLTPNDAELYMTNTLKCNDGFLKLFVTSTGEFLGCVSASDYETLYPIVNP